MKLAIQLVTYQRAEDVPLLLDSLNAQTFQDWELFVLDNSTEACRPRVREVLESVVCTRPMHITWSSENRGFAGGHQTLYEQHDAPYVLLVNPDLILTPTYVAQMVAYLDAHAQVASVMGVVRRWRHVGAQIQYCEAIDSLGLAVHRTGAVTDVRGTVPHKACEVFGVPGCVGCYRRSALQTLPDGDRLFDPAYGSYKEDVELAFRLQAAGHRAALVPSALCYHERAFQSALKQRHVSRFVRLSSYRNHLWNLLTYTSWRRAVRDAWALVPYELAKVVFLACVSPGVLRATVRDTHAYWATLREKRAYYAA